MGDEKQVALPTLGDGQMTRTDMDIAEIDSVSQRFENATAKEIVEWTVDHYDHNVALACSFQDCVIIDLAMSVNPGI